MKLLQDSIARIDASLGAAPSRGDRVAFWARVDLWLDDAAEVIAALYPQSDRDVLTERILVEVAQAAGGRKSALRDLDARVDVCRPRCAAAPCLPRLCAPADDRSARRV